MTDTSLLTQLELEELSLVDSPANPGAMVSLFKRDSGKEEIMTDTVKQEDFDKVQAENERLRKFLIENDYVIKADVIEKKEAPEPVEQIEVEGEMINKSDIPAPVLKALEAAEAEKKDMALTKRAEQELPHFNKEVAKELLKFDLDEKVLEALKAADAAFEAAMGEVGDTDVDGDMQDAQKRLEALVAKTADEMSLTKEKAFAEVAKTAEGKKLINETYAKEKN